MNKKTTIIGGIGALCAVCLIGGGIWYSNNNQTAQQRTELESKLQNSENTTIAVEVPTENVSAGIYEIKTTPSDEKADETLYAKIATINTAAQGYYDSNRGSLLSVFGLMYSEVDNYTVSASKVVAASNNEADDNINDFVDILLVKPSDLAQFDSIKLAKVKDNKLKPFTAYNSADGYIISSVDDEGGILTREEYKSLLSMYASDHGSVRNPNPNEEDYADIAAKTASALNAESYDIKYLACDSKYAVAIIGNVNEPNLIKEYVLIKKSGGWDIIIDNLETSLHPRQDVNALAPDMELGLLPKYTIAEYGEIKTGFVNFEQSLIKLGMISEDDMPETYSCGAGKFAYIEFSSGKKLLGVVNDKKQLEFYPVNDTNSAIATMLNFDEKPPVFILHYSK